MVEYVVIGLVSFFAGATVQRVIISWAIGKVNPSRCDYCRWKKTTTKSGGGR